MKRKQLRIAIVTTLIVFSTTEIGVLASYISNFIQPSFKPLALPLTGILTVILAILTIWLSRLQAPTEQGGTKLDRQRMLARVRALVDDVLALSPYQESRITLNLREQRDAVSNVWTLTIQELRKQSPLPLKTTDITATYEQTAGSLLILGEPGTGKTTLLSELALYLLQKAKNDDACGIPIMLNLSSWSLTQRSIESWLVEELYVKYQVPRKLGQFWIEHDQLLLLLDGFDEVAEHLRKACMKAIIHFRKEHGLVPFVLCSRSKEYWSQNKRIPFHTAVTIEPLSLEHLDDYLAYAGEQFALLRVLLPKDTQLQELISTPLMLGVITLAYQHVPMTELLASGSIETRRRRVFATYVEQMLGRRSKIERFSSPETIRRLSWLGKQMQQRSQTEFYLERLQPDWLSVEWLRRLYFGLVNGILGGLGSGVVFGLLDVQAESLIDALRHCSILAAIGLGIFGILGFSEGGKRKTQTVGSVWSWKNVRQRFIEMLPFGMAVGVGTEIRHGWILTVFGALLAGFVYSVLNVLLSAVNTSIQPVERIRWSWRGMWQNLRKFLPLGLTFGIIQVGLITLFSMPKVGLQNALTFAFDSGLVVVVIIMFLIGLLGALAGGLSRSMLDERTLVKPNEGIWRSARSSIFAGVIGGVLCGVISWFLFGGLFAIGPVNAFRIGLSVGFLCGLLIAAINGGIACFQHSILRLLLLYNRSVTIDYARFLNFAAERILLRKIGGGYMFVHRFLQEYFASEKHTPPTMTQTNQE